MTKIDYSDKVKGSHHERCNISDLSLTELFPIWIFLWDSVFYPRNLKKLFAVEEKISKQTVFKWYHERIDQIWSCYAEQFIIQAKTLLSRYRLLNEESWLDKQGGEKGDHAGSGRPPYKGSLPDRNHSDGIQAGPHHLSIPVHLSERNLCSA